MILSVFLQVVLVLVSVAFLTLLERKVLGYIQLRKGPNKVGFMGLLQPFADGIKLFTKEMTHPSMSNTLPFYISPIFSLSLSFMGWTLIPFFSYALTYSYSIILFLCVVSLSVYMVMTAGWSSNSKYSLLGGMRAGAQTISYEVSLIIILLSPLFMWGSYSYQFILQISFYTGSLVFMMLPLCLSWLITILAETNRTPFDLAEGESELVSGFNTEYSSVGFALIMLSEYASILLMSFMFMLLFSGFNVFLFTFVVYVFLWSRGSYPRYRYDHLMSLSWKSLLPLSISFIPFYLGLGYLL
uniref:NADH-ubiquinone oxidoreductase chain 1 n=1 Tax=Eubranchipus grubii TaxID=381661 RepID=A0A7D7F9D4_9CRUS|nr:NADH dehydrogenase subunit 1 [Eubranchipus grubii]QMP96527.1 NADH dehydrogenase subunit 1 [Eubranchipus grubii]